MPTISGTVTDTDGAPASGYTIRFYRRDTGGYLGETTTGTGSPGVSDPNWANVRVLIPGTDTLDLGVVSEITTQTIFTDAFTDNTYSSVVPGLGSTQVRVGGGKWLRCSAGGATDGYADSLTVDCFYEYDDVASSEYSPNLILGMQCRSASGGDGVAFSLAVTPYGALHLKGRAVVPDTAVVSDNGVLMPDTRYFLRLVQTVSDQTTKLYIDGSLALTHTSAIFPTGALDRNYSEIRVRGPSTNAYIDALRVTDGVVRAGGIPLEPWPTNAVGPAITVGTYTFTTSYTGEVNVVCLDNAAGTVENDLILRTNVT